MFNRENFCESSFYPGDPEKMTGKNEDKHEEDGRLLTGPRSTSPAPREGPDIGKLLNGQTPRTHGQPEGAAQTMSDFPLLYHLLLIRNFYNNSSNQMYGQEHRGTQDQPLDLSTNRNEEYMSAFTKESKKISCDERIKDNEEVEVVHKEDKSQSESVKEFVERKIKEYKKAEEHFESFVNKPNLKENDIKRKMKKIKTKYTKINKKLKKLEEIKPKLLKDNTNPVIPDQTTSPDDHDVCKEREVTQQETSEGNDGGQQNNTMTTCDEEHGVGKTSSSGERGKEQEERLYLGDVGVVDGSRVLLRLENVMHPGRVTSILPPDIYGVLVDRERGNKPHVFSREDLLSRAVLEVRVTRKSQLRLGSRVCVFWSNKMTFLHPALVTGLQEAEEEYVVVTTDDGDTRDLHIDQIRFLPQDFSASGPEEKESVSLPGFKIVTSPSSEKPRRGGVARSEKKKISGRRWRWADGGVVTSPRSKVLHHRQITDGTEVLEVGETAVFLSKIWTELPYLGRIVDMWETVGCKMKVKINWLYHKEEVTGGGDVQVERAVFESSHFDDNNVQSISHKCRVTAYDSHNEPQQYDYCLVGHFDPVREIVTLYTTGQEDL